MAHSPEESSTIPSERDIDLGVLVPLGLTLHTDGLVLRPARESDVADIRRVLRANRDHLAPWSALPQAGVDATSMTEVTTLVLRERREWRKGVSYPFWVALRDAPGSFIGKVALTGIMRGAFQSAHLGYWIDQAHTGRGYGAEAVRAVVSAAFDVCGLHRLEAAIMSSNEASRRLVARLGFRQEGYAKRYLCIRGRWEDHVIYAKTAEEMSNDRSPCGI